MASRGPRLGPQPLPGHRRGQLRRRPRQPPHQGKEAHATTAPHRHRAHHHRSATAPRQYQARRLGRRHHRRHPATHLASPQAPRTQTGRPTALPAQVARPPRSSHVHPHPEVAPKKPGIKPPPQPDPGPKLFSQTKAPPNAQGGCHFPNGRRDKSPTCKQPATYAKKRSPTKEKTAAHQGSGSRPEPPYSSPSISFTKASLAFASSLARHQPCSSALSIFSLPSRISCSCVCCSGLSVRTTSSARSCLKSP